MCPGPRIGTACTLLFHQTAPSVPSVPWREGGGRVLFDVRVCGHLLLSLGTRTSVSHPGREGATDSREVKLGWLGLRMGSMHDAPWSSVSPTPASACARGQARSSTLGVSVLVLLAQGQGLNGTQGRAPLRGVQGSALSPMKAVGCTPRAPRLGEGQGL